MKTKLRILTALILTLCLFAGNVALAQTMPSSQAALEAGKSLRYETTLSLDEGQLMALMSQGMTYMDQETIQGIRLLAGFLKELVISGSLYQEGLTFALGSSKGQAVTGEVSVDEEGSNMILLSMMPGVALSISPEIIQQTGLGMKKQPALTEEEMQQMLAAYLEVIARAFDEQVIRDAAQESGTFPIQDVGSFASKRSFVFTSRDLGALLRAVLEHFKTDKQAQELVMLFVDASQATMALSGQDDDLFDVAPKLTIEDVVASFAREVVSLETGEEQPLFHITLFETEDQKQAYAQLSMAEESVGSQAYILLYASSASEDAFSLRMDILVTYAVQAEETTDDAFWADIREKAQGVRGDEEEAIINLKLDGSLNPEDNRATSRLAISVQTEEISFDVAMDDEHTTAGRYDARQTVSFSMSGEKPLLVLKTSLVETDEVWQLQDAEGLQTLVIDENFGADETEIKALAKAMFMGFPDFLMGFKTAFPETYEHMAEMIVMEMEMMVP
jgi:hypothetical protein